MPQDYDTFKQIFSHLDKMFEHKTIFKSYLNFQIALQNMDREMFFFIFQNSSSYKFKYIKDAVWSDLEKKFEKAKNYKLKTKSWMGGQWSGLSRAPKDTLRRGRTAEPIKSLKDIGKKITQVPKISVYIQNQKNLIHQD